MKILIAGASGFIGTHLTKYLEKRGFDVLKLTRDKKLSDKKNWFYWNPQLQIINFEHFDEVDVIINLSGASIADGRWTKKRKKILLDSRIDPIKCLSEKLINLKKQPLLIQASATGIYGVKRDEVVTEESKVGKGFLANLTYTWEQSTKYLTNSTRTCVLRFGIVLGKGEGFLGQLEPLVRTGLGGTIGNGDQYTSWIHINDLCRAILFLVENNSSSGIYNFTSPKPIINKTLMKTLGRLLHRPIIFRIPLFALKLVFGKEKAKELFESNLKVEPKRLIEEGFNFEFVKIEDALEEIYS